MISAAVLSVTYRAHSVIVGRTVLVLSFTAIVFGALWAVIRFDLAWGEFHWMQRAYDEPYYLWQLQSDSLILNHRFFSTLLSAFLLRLGVPFDWMAETYAFLVPPLVFAFALLLARTWEADLLKRAIWALLLIFAFDLLSGSNEVVFQSLPMRTLAELVGRPGIFKPDAMNFFVVFRRPEPQSSWLFLFPYLAGLLGSFLIWRPSLYRIVCIATPFVALIYVNVALIALIVFALLSILSVVIYRRPMILQFLLSLAMTLAAFGAVFLGADAANVADRSVFMTHLPILRSSIVFSLFGLVLLTACIRRRRTGLSPNHWAAFVFLSVPVITLNQQILTGRAVLPQNWECNGNYICVVIGFAMLAAQSRTATAGRRSVLALVAPPVAWLMIVGLLVRGTLINEQSYVVSNVDSVAYANVYRSAEAKVGRGEKVVLPHLWDESLFLTRAPRNVVVLGGYNWLLTHWLPVWEVDQSFEQHAAIAKASFDVGFETLARRGVSPEQFLASMKAEIEMANCWPTLMYFFSLQDCWPTWSNYTSTGLRRLPEAVGPLVVMYTAYLRALSAFGSKDNTFLITKRPLGPEVGFLFRHELLATMQATIDTIPVEALAYLQTPR